MISFVRYFLMFLFILFLQKYVLDLTPQFIPYSRPVLFFVFLLALPPLPTIWVMAVGFVGGLIFDVFYDTPGINAAACVLIGYIKDPLLRLFKNEEDNISYGSHIVYLGFGRFFFFALTISFIFHTIYGFLDAFNLAETGQTIIRIITNTILSAILIYIYEIIFFYRKATA